MNKTELLEELENSRQEFLDLLNGLTEAEMLEPGVMDGWSIKDILAHLSYWEAQSVTLLFQVQRGIPKPTTVHFGAESVDDLNRRWYEAAKERSFENVWQDWIGVRKQTIRRISELSEKDLFDPQRFSWMNGEALWQLIATDTFEHEAEHAEAIREWLDQRETSSNGHKPQG